MRRYLVEMNNYLNVYYSKEKKVTDYPKKLIDMLISRYNLSGTVLEIGCGRGDFLKEFENNNFKCLGVDINKHPDNDMDVLIHDVSKHNLPYREKSIDVVFLKSAIEHFDSPDQLIKECYRVLNDDGHIIILTPNWLSQYKTFYDDFTHKRPYTKNTLRDLLLSFNFDVITNEVFFQIPLIWKFKFFKLFWNVYSFFINNRVGRILEKIFKIKCLRWGTETILLGVGRK